MKRRELTKFRLSVRHPAMLTDTISASAAIDGPAAPSA